MQVHLGAVGKGAEKLFAQFSREYAKHHVGYLCLPCQIRPAGKVYSHRGKGFVHRHNGMAVATNACLVSQCLFQGQTKRKPHIFYRVMTVNVEVALGDGLKVEATVACHEV